MKFIFEKTGIEYDFQNQLRHSLDYWNHIQDEKSTIVEADPEVGNLGVKNPRDWCPVGSVEFCEDWFVNHCGLKYSKPRNVPVSVWKYREDDILAENHLMGDPWQFIDLTPDVIELNPEKKLFVKSNEKIKDSRNGIYSAKDISGKFNRTESIQISPFIEGIKTEWRVFVFNNSMVSLKHYAGNPLVVPLQESICGMVDCISKGDDVPPAYTLDVYVDKFGHTGPMEMHDFFACGLYGFDAKEYPMMLSQWFSWYKRRNVNSMPC